VDIALIDGTAVHDEIQQGANQRQDELSERHQPSPPTHFGVAKEVTKDVRDEEDPKDEGTMNSEVTRRT